MRRTTTQHTKFWQTRLIDWQKDYFSPEMINHPHRLLLIEKLHQFRFKTLLEVGCAAGANLALVQRYFPHVQIGGVDISAEAIAQARKNFPHAYFDVASADKMFFSDYSLDVIMTDMTLIYLGGKAVKKALADFKRTAGVAVVLVEFYHPSWWKRFTLWLRSGYFAHDYKTLLEGLGYYDIEMTKIPEPYWPNGEPQKTYAYIITARIP